jgi:putative nucleotidyltransferase with HDIG domain
MSMTVKQAQPRPDVAQAIADYNTAIDRLTAEIVLRKEALIERIFDDIQRHDPARAAHCLRVSQYAVDTARELGLDAESVEEIRLAGIFHDYGAHNAPPEILAKQNALTPEERAILRQHVLEGAQVLASIRGCSNVVKIISNHYEWYDGEGGYPGLHRGQAIPIGARILAVTNAYDALITRHPGRKQPLSSLDALMELMARTGTQYDPDVLEVFRQVI